ncbi:MAG: zinc-ribbon domain-containing protein, partial [Limnobacter sp.]|nr:zinc-ribbon domain-containing protein [Limnobacter sp.]
MSLATRCPKCQTLFKVTLGQLQVYEGHVRCGQCSLVFSGIDHLTAADTEVWSGVDLDSTETPSPTAKPIEPQFLATTRRKKAKKYSIPKFKSA